jgi:Fur family ferric uptake transcriptional regulator
MRARDAIMDATQPELNNAAERLREAGLRATKPRLAVLAALEEVRGHKSADELVALLHERRVEIPRSSVYNVLADLAAAGLITHTELGSRGDRYEANNTWHHHLVCRNCGAVVDVPCLVDVHPCLDITVDGALLEQAEVVFRGLCAACAADAAVT